jgi:hypothetical protein
MRKAILGLSMLPLLGTTAFAASPSSNQSINIQGVLRGADGSLQSMAVGLVVNIYSSEMATQPIYSQSFTTVGVDNGFFTVELAGSKLGFSAPDTWVGVQVAGDPAELPRQHINAVPYAFNAVAADSLSGNCSGCVANAQLANPSLTVTAGAGLTGGGQVALGGTVTVSLTNVPSLLITPVMQGTQGINGASQTNYTNYCPAQTITIPAAGIYKVDGTWAGNGGSCPHASCAPVIGGTMINTGTDVWPGIINWSGNWWSSSVHGVTASLPAGPTTIQWQCHFNSACSGTAECYRFALVMNGPY